MDRLERLGVGAPAVSAVTRWLELLRAWNARIDLTAARGEDELADLMLADAMVLARHVAGHAQVVDVGTGAGAPGLALALVRPDLAVTLVEPLAKRVSFIRTVLGTLGRTDVTLVRRKGEDLSGTWDVALSRATMPPAVWLPLGLRLAPATWVLLAREAPPRVPGARVDQDLAYSWPLTGASRRAVRYVRGGAENEGTGTENREQGTGNR
jgi:16S rRNA (guanine527-N7)-methyltransferase